MKKLPTLFRSLFAVAIFGSAAFGQVRSETATIGIPIPLPPVLDVVVRQQADSPLQLNVDEKAKGRLPGSPLTVRNTGASSIEAFVLRIDVEPYGYNQMVVLGPKGLGIGESRMQGVRAPTPNADPAASRPIVSVDLVRFIDGTTWGEDSLGRSKHISAYVEGRSTAMKRLNEMLAGRDDTDFKTAFDVFGASTFGEPNLTPGRPQRNMDWWARGYEEVVNILRRMPRNTDLAKDLARRLETMERPKDS